MTPSERRSKNWIFCGLVAYFLVGYYGCQWVNAHRLETWVFFLPGEREIPFVPAAIIGYALVYASILGIYCLLNDYPHFVRTARLTALVTSVHFLCFLLFPVRMERPPVQPADVATLATGFFYAIDMPANAFPSLHVAYPFLVALVLWHYKRGWSWLFLLFTAIVMVSVVFVKQHYIVDTLAALVLTGIVYVIGWNESKTMCQVARRASRILPNS
ncbi:MAG: phosphatase PAP2 family protein [Deltaproteobacteria bacterium]|nr:phosphatase PAP2 family protein [Deltaproteobacteria bacterium]